MPVPNVLSKVKDFLAPGDVIQEESSMCEPEVSVSNPDDPKEKDAKSEEQDGEIENCVGIDIVVIDKEKEK